MALQMEPRRMAWIDSIRIKHFLIDRYLDYLDEKPLFIAVLEYVLFWAQIVSIINITICYYTAHDVESRLMWFDLTLYVGGIRLYDTIIFILTFYYGASMLKYFHLNNNKTLFKWTDILRVFKGDLSPMSISLFRNDIETFEKLSKIVKILYKFSRAIYLLWGEFGVT